jgi:hypothetical protein
MRALSILLSLSLALIGASTPAAAGTNILGWRLWNPLAETPSETGSIDSGERHTPNAPSGRDPYPNHPQKLHYIHTLTIASRIITVDRKVAMAANGYTLVSSTDSDGLTIEIWSPISNTISKRSPLLPESLPGAKRSPSGVHIKREPALSPSEPRKRHSTTSIPDLEKRDTVDIQGRACSTECGFQAWTKANTDDCISAYETLYNTQGVFTLTTGQAMSATSNGKNCSIWTVNHSSFDISTSPPRPFSFSAHLRMVVLTLPHSVRLLGCRRNWPVAQRRLPHRPKCHRRRVPVRRYRYQCHEWRVHFRMLSDVYDGIIRGESFMDWSSLEPCFLPSCCLSLLFRSYTVRLSTRVIVKQVEPLVEITRVRF